MTERSLSPPPPLPGRSAETEEPFGRDPWGRHTHPAIETEAVDPCCSIVDDPYNPWRSWALQDYHELWNSMEPDGCLLRYCVYRRSHGGRGAHPFVPSSAVAAGERDCDRVVGDINSSPHGPVLRFSDEFEGGNLAEAYVINRMPHEDTTALAERARQRGLSLDFDAEYECILRPDLATRGNTQWFFFAVRGPSKGFKARFYLSNHRKSDSMFNYGMRPWVFSTKRAGSAHTSSTTAHGCGTGDDTRDDRGNASARACTSSSSSSSSYADGDGVGWHRGGYDCCYFRGKPLPQDSDVAPRHDTDSPLPAPDEHYVAAFTYEFQYDEDKVYFAYCLPYSYNRLQRFLTALTAHPTRSQCVRRRLLCRTIAGNRCDVVSVTSPNEPPEVVQARPAVVVSARVHPGETNASWMMEGFLRFITGPSTTAAQLRRRFLFKVVPMLNPDGVIVGNYRVSLAGVDLNRRWSGPRRDMHPTIYSLKVMLEKLHAERSVALFCDLHGHSRKYNAFVYSCKRDARELRGERVHQRLVPLLLWNQSPGPHPVSPERAMRPPPVREEWPKDDHSVSDDAVSSPSSSSSSSSSSVSSSSVSSSVSGASSVGGVSPSATSDGISSAQGRQAGELAMGCDQKQGVAMSANYGQFDSVGKIPAIAANDGGEQSKNNQTTTKESKRQKVAKVEAQETGGTSALGPQRTNRSMQGEDDNSDEEEMEEAPPLSPMRQSTLTETSERKTPGTVCDPDGDWLETGPVRPSLDEVLPPRVDHRRFSYSDCTFRVERSKRSTGRVVSWGKIGIAHSVTLEASFCGTGDNRILRWRSKMRSHWNLYRGRSSLSEFSHRPVVAAPDTLDIAKAVGDYSTPSRGLFSPFFPVEAVVRSHTPRCCPPMSFFTAGDLFDQGRDVGLILQQVLTSTEFFESDETERSLSVSERRGPSPSVATGSSSVGAVSDASGSDDSDDSFTPPLFPCKRVRALFDASYDPNGAENDDGDDDAASCGSDSCPSADNLPPEERQAMSWLRARARPPRPGPRRQGRRTGKLSRTASSSSLSVSRRRLRSVRSSHDLSDRSPSPSKSPQGRPASNHADLADRMGETLSRRRPSDRTRSHRSFIRQMSRSRSRSSLREAFPDEFVVYGKRNRPQTKQPATTVAIVSTPIQFEHGFSASGAGALGFPGAPDRESGIGDDWSQRSTSSPLQRSSSLLHPPPSWTPSPQRRVPSGGSRSHRGHTERRVPSQSIVYGRPETGPPPVQLRSSRWSARSGDRGSPRTVPELRLQRAAGLPGSPIATRGSQAAGSRAVTTPTLPSIFRTPTRTRPAPSSLLRISGNSARSKGANT